MKVQIHNLRELNGKQQEKIIAALNKGFPLVNMPIWENRILKLSLRETKGMTNAQIITLIRSGKDGNGVEADGDIDIDITGFFKRSSTVGYTYLGSTRTWINRRFLDKFSEAEVFGHVFHEALHRYGFEHKVHKGSVPYEIGYASRYAFLEHYSGRSLLNLEVAAAASFMGNPTFTYSIVS